MILRRFNRGPANSHPPCLAHTDRSEASVGVKRAASLPMADRPLYETFASLGCGSSAFSASFSSAAVRAMDLYTSYPSLYDSHRMLPAPSPPLVHGPAGPLPPSDVLSSPARDNTSDSSAAPCGTVHIAPSCLDPTSSVAPCDVSVPRVASIMADAAGFSLSQRLQCSQYLPQAVTSEELRISSPATGSSEALCKEVAYPVKSTAVPGLVAAGIPEGSSQNDDAVGRESARKKARLASTSASPILEMAIPASYADRVLHSPLSMPSLLQLSPRLSDALALFPLSSSPHVLPQPGAESSGSLSPHPSEVSCARRQPPALAPAPALADAARKRLDFLMRLQAGAISATSSSAASASGATVGDAGGGWVHEPSLVLSLFHANPEDAAPADSELGGGFDHDFEPCSSQWLRMQARESGGFGAGAGTAAQAAAASQSIAAMRHASQLWQRLLRAHRSLVDSVAAPGPGAACKCPETAAWCALVWAHASLAPACKARFAADDTTASGPPSSARIATGTTQRPSTSALAFACSRVPDLAAAAATAASAHAFGPGYEHVAAQASWSLRLAVAVAASQAHQAQPSGSLPEGMQASLGTASARKTSWKVNELAHAEAAAAAAALGLDHGHRFWRALAAAEQRKTKSGDSADGQHSLVRPPVIDTVLLLRLLGIAASVAIVSSTAETAEPRGETDLVFGDNLRPDIVFLPKSPKPTPLLRRLRARCGAWPRALAAAAAGCRDDAFAALCAADATGAVQQSEDSASDEPQPVAHPPPEPLPLLLARTSEAYHMWQRVALSGAHSIAAMLGDRLDEASESVVLVAVPAHVLSALSSGSARSLPPALGPLHLAAGLQSSLGAGTCLGAGSEAVQRVERRWEKALTRACTRLPSSSDTGHSVAQDSPPSSAAAAVKAALLPLFSSSPSTGPVSTWSRGVFASAVAIVAGQALLTPQQARALVPAAIARWILRPPTATAHPSEFESPLGTSWDSSAGARRQQQLAPRRLPPPLPVWPQQAMGVSGRSKAGSSLAANSFAAAATGHWLPADFAAVEAAEEVCAAAAGAAAAADSLDVALSQVSRAFFDASGTPVASSMNRSIDSLCAHLRFLSRSSRRLTCHAHHLSLHPPPSGAGSHWAGAAQVWATAAAARERVRRLGAKLTGLGRSAQATMAKAQRVDRAAATVADEGGSKNVHREQDLCQSFQLLSCAVARLHAVVKALCAPLPSSPATASVPMSAAAAAAVAVAWGAPVSADVGALRKPCNGDASHPSPPGEQLPTPLIAALADTGAAAAALGVRAGVATVVAAFTSPGASADASVSSAVSAASAAALVHVDPAFAATAASAAMRVATAGGGRAGAAASSAAARAAHGSGVSLAGLFAVQRPVGSARGERKRGREHGKGGGWEDSETSSGESDASASAAADTDDDDDDGSHMISGASAGSDGAVIVDQAAVAVFSPSDALTAVLPTTTPTVDSPAFVPASRSDSLADEPNYATPIVETVDSFSDDSGFSDEDGDDEDDDTAAAIAAVCRLYPFLPRYIQPLMPPVLALSAPPRAAPLPSVSTVDTATALAERAIPTRHAEFLRLWASGGNDGRLSRQAGEVWSESTGTGGVDSVNAAEKDLQRFATPQPRAGPSVHVLPISTSYSRSHRAAAAAAAAAVSLIMAHTSPMHPLLVLPAAASHFPPCMLRLLLRLLSHGHLKYHGRLHLSLFLKSIGLPFAAATALWRLGLSAKGGAAGLQHALTVGSSASGGTSGSNSGWVRLSESDAEAWGVLSTHSALALAYSLPESTHSASSHEPDIAKRWVDKRLDFHNVYANYSQLIGSVAPAPARNRGQSTDDSKEDRLWSVISPALPATSNASSAATTAAPAPVPPATSTSARPAFVAFSKGTGNKSASSKPGNGGAKWNKYEYFFKHNYGLAGAGKDYSCLTCHEMAAPGTGQGAVVPTPTLQRAQASTGPGKAAGVACGSGPSDIEDLGRASGCAFAVCSDRELVDLLTIPPQLAATESVRRGRHRKGTGKTGQAVDQWAPRAPTVGEVTEILARRSTGDYTGACGLFLRTTRMPPVPTSTGNAAPDVTVRNPIDFWTLSRVGEMARKQNGSSQHRGEISEDPSMD